MATSNKSIIITSQNDFQQTLEEVAELLEKVHCALYNIICFFNKSLPVDIWPVPVWWYKIWMNDQSRRINLKKLLEPLCHLTQHDEVWGRKRHIWEVCLGLWVYIHMCLYTLNRPCLGSKGVGVFFLIGVNTSDWYCTILYNKLRGACLIRSCILCNKGGWTKRKRCGPSGWVPVWVTLYPGGLDGGDERERGEGKALPV